MTTAPAPTEQQEGGTMPSKTTWSRGETWLLRAGIASGIGVGTLGLASSYRALERKAAAPVAAGGWNWGGQAWMLPVGVDLGILTFSVVNLLLVKAERPLAWVKWVPRTLTIVTIVLNWQTGATLEGKLGHAALAALWVVLSEIAAHLYAAHIGRLKGRREMERIRLARWLHHPISSARINRLMKTWEITSYTDALERDRQRAVYRSTLRQDHGRLWRFKAPENKLQPLRLLAFGMTLEEALAEPDRQEDAERLRAQQRDLQRAEARLQKVEAESQVRVKELEAEAAEIRAAGSLKAAKAEADAAASVAVQQAEADLQVRQAEAEAEIKRLAAEAEAKVKELQDAEQAREDERARQREKDQLTWQAELNRMRQQQAAEEQELAVEARREEIEAAARAAAQTAEENRRRAEADAAAAKAAKDAAEARRQQTEADLKAEQARVKQAQAEAHAKALEKQAALDAAATEAARLKAAQDQLKAAQAEAEARLSPVERDARKVADMIRAEGLDAITLARIETALGVSAGTASGRRKRALEILRESGELPAQRLNGHDLTHA